MSIKINPKTFCLAPWVHTTINTEKQMTPCCMYKTPSEETYEKFNDWWTGEHMSSLRQNLLNGVQASGCSRCWSSEKMGRESLRQSYNNIFKSYADFDCLQKDIKNQNYSNIADPISWELNVGNLCNLKCIMCDPLRSDKIQNEVLESITVFKDFPVLVEQASSYSQKNWIETNTGKQFTDQIKNNVKWLKLQGGEALTVKGVRNFISELNHTQVTLALTTNGTVLDDKLLDILSQFKRVEVSISLEAAGEENDIIRYGSDWQTIEKNILQLKALPNVDLQINHVLQVTSCLFLPEVLIFAEKNNLHLALSPLTHPEYLCMSACPPKLVANLLDRLKKIPVFHPKNIWLVDYVEKFVNSQAFDSRKHELFIKYVETLDVLRNKKLAEICKPLFE